ncbi:MAG: serine/threonine protein kinase, partial [Labilithrix sp.]|nr:serine/threonine protein kinase [Labilithrix sp.]
MSDEVVIDQRFRLGRVLRESGVAVVYEARHRNGADAWIKLPRSLEYASAITTEARLANALGKNAVNVRDDGITEDGLPYLVQEPVTGQRLDHWRKASGGRAPPDEAMGLGDELCHAIGTLHQAGFVVGLLRADAIIVVPKGGMCLLELEHARPVTPESVKEDVVRVGRVLYEMLSGTPSLAQSPPL